MGTNEYGHGYVLTYDKNKVTSGILGGVSSSKSTSTISTPQEAEFKDVKLFPYYTSKGFVEIGEGYAVRNLQFKSDSFLEKMEVIGEIRIPAYISETAMTVAFSISFFDAMGKYLGGTRFPVYHVRPSGGVYPFSVLMFDISGKVESCHIRPQGAWGAKED